MLKNILNIILKKQRDNVKFITLDLYKPYYKLMHSLFRNAILIPDRFHIVIQARNAFDYEYSNVIVEGTNNFKQIKYTAYGYRKFKHLKARVMLIKELLNPIKTY